MGLDPLAGKGKGKRQKKSSYVRKGLDPKAFITTTGIKATSAYKNILNLLRQKKYPEARVVYQKNRGILGKAAKQIEKEINQKEIQHELQTYYNLHGLEKTLTYIDTHYSEERLKAAELTKWELRTDSIIQNSTQVKSLPHIITKLKISVTKLKEQLKNIKDSDKNKEIEKKIGKLELLVVNLEKAQIQSGAVAYKGQKGVEGAYAFVKESRSRFVEAYKKSGMSAKLAYKNMTSIIANLRIQVLVNKHSLDSVIKRLSNKKKYKEGEPDLKGLGEEKREAKLAELQLRAIRQKETFTEEQMAEIKPKKAGFEKKGLNVKATMHSLAIDLIQQMGTTERLEQHIAQYGKQLAEAGIPVVAIKWRIQVSKWAKLMSQAELVKKIEAHRKRMENDGINVDFILHQQEFNSLLSKGKVKEAIELLINNKKDFGGETKNEKLNKDLAELIKKGEFEKALKRVDIAYKNREIGDKVTYERAKGYVRLHKELGHIAFMIKVRVPSGWKGYFEKAEELKLEADSQAYVGRGKKSIDSKQLARLRRLLSGVKSLQDKRWTYLPPNYNRGDLDVRTVHALI
ncbi:hypothetical protein ACFL52_04560, partial [Candidatus Margulisiibacteriota bacterium]